MDSLPKILIACPVYDGKEYSMTRWLNAIRFLDYPSYSVLMVDTSNGTDFFERWRKQVAMAHLELATETTPDSRVAMGMEAIRKAFLVGDWQIWLNIEADVIVPPHTIRMMLPYMRGVDFLAAPYPHRREPRMIEGCFGCTMFSRNIAHGLSFEDAPTDSHTDMWFRAKTAGYRVSNLPSHLLKLVHLDN